MASSAATDKKFFKKGAEVEVNFDEPGFRGSWYSGTVFRPPFSPKSSSSSSTSKIFVEFDSLLDHDHPSQKLREELNLIWVRPAPPRELHRSFQLSEDVDAFHKDGWWEGVVTAIHSPSSPSSATTYSVFFPSTREQLQFPESDLRLHREWVYGKWVPPLEVVEPPSTPLHHNHVDDVNDDDDYDHHDN